MPASSTSAPPIAPASPTTRKAIGAHGVDVAIVLKVHPSNYRVDGFRRGHVASRAGDARASRWWSTSAAACSMRTCPWLAGPPPAWLAGEPAAVQTLADGAALVTFSGDKLLGGPQAGIIAGRADLVAACAAHPLARALRPGGLVLAALQHIALAYLRRDATATIPFWRDGRRTRSTTLRDRAERIVDRGGRR